MEQIRECSMVTIEYSIRTTSPTGGESELAAQTCSFVMGVDVQYPSVERALMDKGAGDRVKVCVPPEEIFGHYDDTLVRELPREDYKQERLREGCMYREIKRRSLVQFLVKELRDDVVVADFNHPNAGACAEFDILVKDVRPATKTEMAPSCAKGPNIGC